MSETYTPDSWHDLWLAADGLTFEGPDERMRVCATTHEAIYPYPHIVISVHAEPVRVFGPNEHVISDLLTPDTRTENAAFYALFGPYCLTCRDNVFGCPKTRAK